MFVLPLWAVGLTVAIVGVLGVLAYDWTGRERLIGALAPATLVLLGAGVSLFFLDGGPGRELSAERRALDMRAQELLMHAAMQNSTLACLDTYAGAAVEASCEKSLFATPESVAAALSYVSAQLWLLSDFTDHARRARSGQPLAIVNLRRSIEGDRFGLVAQVLTVRDGCISNDCLALASLHDPNRIGSNLAEGTFDFFVARHVADWPAGGTRPLAAAASSAETPTLGATVAGTASATGATGTASRRPPSELFFPSSSSIPPINIMTAEPATTGQPGTDAPPTKQTTRATPRRSAPSTQPTDLNTR